MVSLQNRLMAVAAGLMIAGAASSAFANPTFTVNESGAAGVAPAGCSIFPSLCFSTFQANQMGLNYLSNVALNTGNGTFSESGSLNITSFLNGNPEITVSGTHINSTYSLLANFNGAGTFTGNGSPSFTGTFTSFSFTLFLAPTSQLSALDANKQYTIASPDIVVATGGQNGPGQAHIFPSSPAQGDFHVFNSFLITPDGKNFFTQPVDFYVAFDASGNNNSTSCTPGGENLLNCALEGGGKAQFLVPEPGTLALLGGSILGLGLISRRRRKLAA